MDVGEWLRGLGLGKYEDIFRANAIDADLLPRLTGDDLKEIGVSALGDRLRLLDAIAVLAGAKPQANLPASPPKSAPDKSPQVSAERRPITVVFCDLVGSTSLAAKLDMEDWRNLVNGYLDEASKAVAGFGGHVLKKLGDGLMALFGYPQAQENDAERAVRAALAIQRALVEINAKNCGKGSPDLLARIGIESGPVVVEATGEVFGDAPNVAARVQAAATPGSVLVTMNVQRQVAGLFVAEEQGARELKGVSEPVQLFRIIRASGGGRRGGARALTPFVGREEELVVLARRWERSRAGEGQLVLIVGEPGLGKSRLIEEFHTRLAGTPHTWVEWSASQLLQNTPLHPIAEWGRLRFGVDAPAEQRLADLENTLRLIGLDPVELAPLLAPLVDIPLPPGRVANLPPEELRRRQLAAMTNMVLAGARSQPAVVVFEDLHWADPTSIDLMRALADRGAQAPLLLLATTRPEFRPPWSLRSHHVVISLSPLDRAGVARMVGEISAQHALSKDVIEGVSERTGGVPLFVEEVTRLLLERGVQGSVQAIPPTLQQSLAARLDRLGRAREVAQIGAVLGRDFAYTLVREVAEIDEPALQASLDRLADADLLYVDGAPPQASYRFKHALIQDAAYDSLLKSRRQALHRRAAELLRDDPEHAAAEPEVIAHHFTQAGLDDLAIEWWGRAGDQALRRSAFQEAIAHLGKAIAMADKITEAHAGEVEASAARRRITPLRVAYGNALLPTHGYGAPDTTNAFAIVREIADRDNAAPERLAAYYGLWVSSFVRGELPSMRAHAAALFRDVEERPASPEASVAHRILGTTHWYAAEFVEARHHLERALALFQPGRDDDLAFSVGQDGGVAAMLYLAITLWQLGEAERAVSLLADADARSGGLAHIGTQAYGKAHSGLFGLMRGDLSQTASTAAVLAHLARDHDLNFWLPYGVFLEGWAKTETGALADGLDEMRRGLELLRGQNCLNFVPLFTLAIGRVEAQAGDLDRAIRTLNEGLELSDRIGHRAFDAELHRVRGELWAQRDPTNPTPVEEAYKTAIAIANQQGARSYELLASLALAKLYQSTGRFVEAHDILATALEGFSPTPEMSEIAEAQALLAVLAESEEIKAAEAQRQRRVHLQTAYGQAMMMAKGYAAEETRAAFARAAELGSTTRDFSERSAALQGQFSAAATAGELLSARALALTLLGEAEAAGRVWEACVANNHLGLIAYWQGDFNEARTHCERALDAAAASPGPNNLERFGDGRTQASSFLAATMWQLGEVERARELINWATKRANEVGHMGALADVLFWKLYVEVWRADPPATLTAAEALVAVAGERGMMQFLNEVELHLGWARGRIDNPVAGAAQMQRVLAAFVEQGVRVNLGFYTGLLAQLEAEALGAESALARIDEAFRLSNAVKHGCSLPFLHRLRGEILLKRDPADIAPAEEAFRTSIAIAKEQSARSPVLLASLALAKLLQSTARPAEAHAVLAPALEGFAPTPEMPQIAEAQTLLGALADTEEVKAAEAQRQRRAHLQTAYGQAMMWAKGFSADETRAAFSRATEITAKTDSFADRFAAAHFRWSLAFMRGELRSSRELELSFLKEAEEAGRIVEAGVARRGLALSCYAAADFLEARTHCERALETCEPEREREARERFQSATGPIVMPILAVTMWQLGEVERARELIEEANRRASDLGDAPSMVHPLLWKVDLGILRGDPIGALSAAEALERLCGEHGMSFWRTAAETGGAWAHGRLHDAAAGAEDLRRALADRAEQDARFDAWYFTGLLAELEAKALGTESALARLDEAMALTRQVETRCNLPFLHLLRGKLLLERDPSNPAPAEEAFRTALAIAQEQGARSWGLRAALSLAKLYQSTARLAQAHVVLAPALKGFSPTPEMPEIAEAQAMLAHLASVTYQQSSGRMTKTD
jgi:class 3 adenylate cyclase/predicted ATPase